MTEPMTLHPSIPGREWPVAGEDKVHRKWVESRRCCKCGHHPQNTAHHLHGGQAGVRAHDHASMPLCEGPNLPVGGCHRAFHDRKGPFEDWTNFMREMWQLEQVRTYRPREDDGESYVEVE